MLFLRAFSPVNYQSSPKNVRISPKRQISGMQLHASFRFGLDPYLRIFLRIFQDDFHQKVKNIHDEMEKHHSYTKRRVYE